MNSDSKNSLNRLDDREGDLSFFQSALSHDDHPQIDMEAVQHRVKRIVRRRIAFRAVAATVGIVVGSTLLFSVATHETEPVAVTLANEVMNIELLRATLAEIEEDLDALELASSRSRIPQASIAAATWIATASESFEEETAALMLGAAMHRYNSKRGMTGSQSRFEEIVSYFPNTLAASTAREHLSMLNVQAN